eukprot:TRINITY_DN71979_c0_g1_i1.p1 TRINITY_DN71979_c0_g1~~TRINITY_DN71979_c0_g1_i1.p1  ORF type:complete len:579 (+),score=134.98 TRINITY_DN71979_c0_g1_i1:40-1737(+)
MDEHLDKILGEVPLPDGVSKKIVAEAPDSNSAVPKKGDEVHIHYTGWLADGTKFDSSHDRPGDFHFVLGNEEVNKGLDLGVATMRRLEKATFVLSPEFAYGEEGAPPKIPPNATLTFDVELLYWKRRGALTSDGGIIKTVEQEGTGMRKPALGDSVRVKYVGYVKGIEFLRSTDDGSEFNFLEGNPLSLPVQTMKTILPTMFESEVAIIRLAAAHAYGDTPAFDGKVPPASEVTFALSLLDIYPVETCGFFKEKSVVSPERFPTVQKQQRRAGTGYEKPEDLSQIRAVVNGKELEWTLLLAPERCEAIECALLEMTKGSECVISMKDSSLCRDADVPMESAAGPQEIRIELLDFDRAPEPRSLSRPERLERGERLKARAAALMKAQDYRRALRLYRSVQDLFGYIDDWPDEQERLAADALRQTSKGNEVLAWLRLEQWRDAEELSSEIMNGGGFSRPDPANVKALYRRGQAFLGLKEVDNARKDFEKVLELDPNNAEAKQQLAKVRQLAKEQKKSEQDMYRNMMTEVGSMDYPVGCETAQMQMERERDAMLDRTDKLKSEGMFVL